MSKQPFVPMLRVLSSLSIAGFLLAAAGCEEPLNIIVSTTSLPADTDGLEFLVRTIADPMGGQDGVQTAADTPAQRVLFADTQYPTGDEFTFGLYLSSELTSGKIQVNVAALKHGCPIATGVAEVNPPLSLQRLPVDVRPTLGPGTADFVNGCQQGAPQIFGVVRSDIQIDANPETLLVSLAGWGYYPTSQVAIAFDPNPGVSDPRTVLPVPMPVSDNASDVHTTYQVSQLPIPLSSFEMGFSGQTSVKVTVTNPDNQAVSILLSQLN